MRNILSILILTSLLFLGTGCSDLLTFDLNAEVEEFTVVGDARLNHEKMPLISAVPAIDIQLPNADVGQINLTDLVFHVTNTSLAGETDEDSLEFLSSMTVSVSTQTPNPKLPPIEIGTWYGPIERGTTEIEMEVDDSIDLAPYVAAGLTFKITPTGVIPYDDVSIKGDMIFAVNPL